MTKASKACYTWKKPDSFNVFTGNVFILLETSLASFNLNLAFVLVDKGKQTLIEHEAAPPSSQFHSNIKSQLISRPTHCRDYRV